MFRCRLTITYFPIFLLFFFFVLLLHFTLSHLISLFSHPTWCLTWVQHLHFILAYSICHSFIIIFHVGILRSVTHDVFYALRLMHEGYENYIIGIFEPSFLLFLSPYYLILRYVPCLKTTLRPWLHVVLDNSHMGNTWDWLEIISWSMMDGELKWWITLGDTPLIGGGFSEVMWSTLGHILLIDDSFFQDDTLH